MLYKKAVLKIFQYFQETPVLQSVFNKVAGLRKGHTYSSKPASSSAYEPKLWNIPHAYLKLDRKFKCNLSI